MQASIRIDEGVCKSEIDKVHCVGIITESHQGVARFQIAMNLPARVHEFEALQVLMENHQSGFQGESMPAQVE